MSRPRLHVCITCRAGQALAPGEAPAGERLHAALETALSGTDTLPFDLHGVSCMANCERGCTAAISAPGKWSYLLAGLRPDHAPDLLVYGAAYAASQTGTVLPSRRPESLRHAVLARMPDLTAETVP